jgi:hypothetical protein
LSPETETAFLKKIDEQGAQVKQIHDYLVGDPLGNPPKTGLIQQHQDNTKAILESQKDIKGLKEWRNQIKMRLTFIAGGFAVIAFLFNRAWEWLTSHK